MDTRAYNDLPVCSFITVPSVVHQCFDTTNDEDGFNLQFHLWRSVARVHSGIYRYLLIVSTTECELLWSQVTSISAFITNHRLTAVLTDQHGRSCSIMFQSKTQTRQHFLVPFRITVSSCYGFRINACSNTVVVTYSFHCSCSYSYLHWRQSVLFIDVCFTFCSALSTEWHTVKAATDDEFARTPPEPSNPPTPLGFVRLNFTKS